MNTAPPPQNGPYPYAPPPGYQSSATTTAMQAPAQPVPQAWSTPQQWGHQPALFQQPKPGNGLAIAAVAMSTLALLGVLAFAALLFLGPGGGSWALSGEVTPASGAVTAQALEDELGSVLEEDGAVVDELTCPSSSPVGQGEVTVCRGDVDGADWIGIVVFESDSGEFVLTEY